MNNSTPSDQIQDKTQRMVVAAQELLEEGSLTRGQTITLVATSAIETARLLLLSRVDGTVFQADPATNCFPSCVRVALEADYNNLAGLGEQFGTPGSGNIRGLVIDPDWYGDAEGMDILQKSSLNPQPVQGNDGKTYWVHIIDYSTPWDQTYQLGFEYALTQQKGLLLKQYDMGPMNTRCIGMGPVAAAMSPPRKQVNGFPATWDDMFSLYTSTTYVDAFKQDGHWYLPPIYNGEGGQWPGDDTSNAQLAYDFCSRQLGGADASAYAASLIKTMNELIANL